MSAWHDLGSKRLAIDDQSELHSVMYWDHDPVIRYRGVLKEDNIIRLFSKLSTQQDPELATDDQLHCVMYWDHDSVIRYRGVLILHDLKRLFSKLSAQHDLELATDVHSESCVTYRNHDPVN